MFAKDRLGDRPVRTQDIQLAGLPSSPWLQCWRNPASGSAYLFSKGVSVIISCSESLQPFIFFSWGLAASSIFVLCIYICVSHQFLSIHKSPLSLGGSTFTCTFALQYFACHKHSYVIFKSIAVCLRDADILLCISLYLSEVYCKVPVSCPVSSEMPSKREKALQICSWWCCLLSPRPCYYFIYDYFNLLYDILILYDLSLPLADVGQCFSEVIFACIFGFLSYIGDVWVCVLFEE